MSVFINVRKALEEKGISVTEFETKINLQRGGFYKWKNHEPSAFKVKAAAEFLGVSMESLMKDE